MDAEAKPAPCYLWQGKFWCLACAPSQIVAVYDTRVYRNDGPRPRMISETRTCAGCGVIMRARVEERT
jgi:hypothetical protein